jgi:predicted methyltransferase
MVSAMLTLQPASAQFAGIVHDPLNEVHFIAQIENQINQISQVATQIQNQRTNLQTYSGSGLWTRLQQRLVSLQAQIANARKTDQITGGVADAQMAQMNQEMATLNNLENLANGSVGNVQAQQAQARLQSEMIAQLQEQRQLTLAQLKQAQIEADQAMQRYHGAAQDPSSY